MTTEERDLLIQQANAGDAEAAYRLAELYRLGEETEKDDAAAVAWYRKAADQGDAKAQYSLGVMYEEGRGVEKDDVQVFAWFRKAAEQGYSGAQYRLGLMYYYGLGVEKDQEKAVVWYRKAAEQGQARAQYNLGVMYEDGRGVKKDCTQALAWYRKAEEQGDVGAKDKLAFICEDVVNGEMDNASALSRYENKAWEGDARAAFEAAQALRFGVEASLDPEAALYWCTQAALRGFAQARIHLYAFAKDLDMADPDIDSPMLRRARLRVKGEGPDYQCVYGMYLRYGWGGRPDPQQASALFLEGARAGHAGCMNNIGIMHEKGDAVLRDLQQAATWYRRAAEKDDPSGQANIARMCLEGWGVPLSVEEAFDWYRKAVANGSHAARIQLGKLYESGRCYRLDEEPQGVAWFTCQAEKDPAARCHLAGLYERGAGVKADLARAFALYKSAAEAGDVPSQIALSKFYTFGWGGTRDIDQAFTWCKKSFVTGDIDGLSHLAYLYSSQVQCSESGLFASRLYDAINRLRKTQYPAPGWDQAAANYVTLGCYDKAVRILKPKLLSLNPYPSKEDLQEYRRDINSAQHLPVMYCRFEEEDVYASTDMEWNFFFRNSVKKEGTHDYPCAFINATEALNRALATESKVDLAASLNRFGELLLIKKCQLAALAFFRRALALRVRQLGPKHHEVADSLQWIFSVPKRLTKQESLFVPRKFKNWDRLLAICSAPKQPSITVYTLWRLASIFRGDGNITYELKVQRRVVKILIRDLGRSHDRTRWLLYSIESAKTHYRDEIEAYYRWRRERGRALFKKGTGE